MVSKRKKKRNERVSRSNNDNHSLPQLSPRRRRKLNASSTQRRVMWICSVICVIGFPAMQLSFLYNHVLPSKSSRSSRMIDLERAKQDSIHQNLIGENINEVDIEETEEEEKERLLKGTQRNEGEEPRAKLRNRIADTETEAQRLERITERGKQLLAERKQQKQALLNATVGDRVNERQHLRADRLRRPRENFQPQVLTNNVVERLKLRGGFHDGSNKLIAEARLGANPKLRDILKRGGKRNFASCDLLFSIQNFELTVDGKCIQHMALPDSRACQLGSISIDNSKIIGSLGGENISSVWLRDESREQPRFSLGALTFHEHHGTFAQTFPLPSDTLTWGSSFANDMIHLLKSGLAIENNTTNAWAVLPSNFHSQRQPHANLTAPPKEEISSNSTAILINRGDYANPCMTILDMFNAFMVLNKFQLLDAERTIVWLDGHAKGSLDDAWATVFQTKPMHIKQLPERIKFQNSIAVNTRSVVGEEGLKMYAWRKGRTMNTFNCSLDPEINTLVQFRSFVLEKFGIQRTSNPDGRRLTFLVRRNYFAHPRSDGRADRVLANLTLDMEYIQSVHPEYNMTVVSFEDLAFREQLAHIAQTDLLVAVHGAGNVHSIFLPDHATFIEYFPKEYKKRMRFRFLSECLNLTYIAKHAWVVEKFDSKTKVSLQLKPRDAYERSNTLWHNGKAY